MTEAMSGQMADGSAAPDSKAPGSWAFDVGEADFAQLVVENSMQVPVLVDFWAPWCQPCQGLMPMLAALADDYQGGFLLAKVNTEEQQALASHFGIRSIPTLKLFFQGQVVEEIQGAQPESAFRELLDKYVVRESDAAISQAEALLASGDNEAAWATLLAAQQQDPSNQRVLAAVGNMAIDRGELDTAETVAQHLQGEAGEALKAKIGVSKQLSDAPDEAELLKRLQDNPNDSEAIHLLALRHIALGNIEQGLDALLDLMRRDREYGDDAARKAMLDVFQSMGDDPRVGRYRRAMFAAMH